MGATPNLQYEKVHKYDIWALVLIYRLALCALNTVGAGILIKIWDVFCSLPF